jgi:hypothetical protein
VSPIGDIRIFRIYFSPLTYSWLNISIHIGNKNYSDGPPKPAITVDTYLDKTCLEDENERMCILTFTRCVLVVRICPLSGTFVPYRAHDHREALGKNANEMLLAYFGIEGLS